MAFPTVIAEAGGNAGNSTSVTINLPNGSNVSGRLILVFLNSDGSETFTFPSGWVQIYTHALAAQTTDAWYHHTDGTEGYPGTGATISVTISSSESTGHSSYLISGHDPGTNPVSGTSAAGADTNPNPPNLDPAGWGTEDTLWFAVGSSNGGTFSAGPASYTNFRTDQSGTAATAGIIAVARRENATGAENPGTFTKDTADQWTANTVAVRPSAGTNVAITGNAATSAVGTLALALSLALSGPAATASVGTLSPDRTVAISGVAATASVGNVAATQVLVGVGSSGAAGTIAPSVDLALTGISATGSVGTVTYSAGGDLNLALSGVASSAAVGTVVSDRALAVTGSGSTAAVGTVAPALALGAAGVGATGAVGTLSPARAVPLTGAAATGAVGSVVVQVGGDINLALSGNAATGSPGTLAPARALALTGNGATVVAGSVTPTRLLSGVSATAAVGSATSVRSLVLAGVAATGAAGTIVASTPTDVVLALSGVSALGIAGTIPRAGPGHRALGVYTIEQLLAHQRQWMRVRS